MMYKKMYENLKKWVINDYYTPNLKAEITLDTLLTPYVAGIVKNQCRDLVGDVEFVTKEMSILDETRKDNRGEKVDYVLADQEYVYLVELKTTDSSTLDKQTKRYFDHCAQERTFGDVLGKKLLTIMLKAIPQKEHENKIKELSSFPKDGDEGPLRKLFCVICGDCGTESYADRARQVLKEEKWVSTCKYLYTMGQILDYLYPKAGESRTIWKKQVKLLYLTPTGNPPCTPCEDFGKLVKEQYPDFYLYPNKKNNPDLIDSVSLLKAAEGYLDTQENDELAKLLAEILIELYKREDGQK